MIKGVVSAFGVCLIGSAVATDFTWQGGSSTDWTQPTNWDQGESIPGTGDTIIVPANATLKLVAGDTGSIAIANAVDTIKVQPATSFLELSTPEPTDEITLGCKIVSYKDWRVRDAGAINKTGAGTVYLTDETMQSYYVNVHAIAGVIHMPKANGHSGHLFYGVLTADAGATIYVASGKKNEVPWPNAYMIRGAGTIASEATTSYGDVLYVRSGDYEGEFSGVITGNLRLVCGARLDLNGPNANPILRTYACNNKGAYPEGACLAFNSFDKVGTGGILGFSCLDYGDDCSGAFHYTGNGGETANHSITLNSPMTGASFFDAGAYGGFTLSGSINAGGAAKASDPQHYALVLTGSNTTSAAVFTGSMSERQAGDAIYTITNIMKRGTGVWKFGENANRTWSGMLTVEEGRFEFTSLAAKGTKCSLGTATNAFPAAMLLKTGGELSYVGENPFTVKDRPLKIAGAGTFSNASSSDITLGPVSALEAGSVLTVDCAAGTTTTLCDVTDGEGTLRIVKRGAGTLKFAGAQTYTGGLSVEAGDLALTREKYEYYRFAVVTQQVGNINIYVPEFSLFDKDGVWQTHDIGYTWCAQRYDELQPGKGTLDYPASNSFKGVGDSAEDGFAKLFDDSMAHVYFYGKHTNGDWIKPVGEDDPDNWFRVVIRMPAGAKPVKYFDYPIKGSGQSQYSNGPQRVKLFGSADMTTWTELADVTASNPKAWQPIWAVDGGDYTAGDCAKGHKAGVEINPFAQPAPALAGYCEIGSGVTISGYDTEAVVSKVRVAEANASDGTFAGVAFAAVGELDVTGLGVKSGRIPLAFTDCEGVANIRNWTLKVNGAEKPTWSLGYEDDSFYIKKPGFILNIK